MTDARRKVLMRAVPVLALAAAAGFLFGTIPRSAAPPTMGVLVAGKASHVSPVVLEYATPGWSNASQVIAVPGLALTDEIALAPRKHPAGTGLIAGSATENSSSPLPTGLLARLRERPEAEVVSLLDAQAYRYRGLTPAGLGMELTLYVVPYGNGSATTIVCYARLSPHANSQLSKCEGVVSTLTLALGSAHFSLELTPEPRYARQVSEVVTGVDRARIALRAEMHLRAPASSLSESATQLAGAFARASRSVSVLQPPPPAAAVQSTLASALGGAGEAYLELARTAQTRNRPGFGAARTRVYSAEAQFAAALGGYALLGYR